MNKAQGSASTSTNPFDLLATFGNDISALAALTGANMSQLDSAALAQFSALAQLNQLAASNPKVAAAAMLQLQQQNFLNQSPSLGQISSISSPVPSTSNSNHQMMVSSLPITPAANHQSSSLASGSVGNTKLNHNRYQQLLSIIDEMGRDIRTSYMGNKNSIERLKRSIASARILVKDCQIECERNTKN
jgi:hypothetical protein